MNSLRHRHSPEGDDRRINLFHRRGHRREQRALVLRRADDDAEIMVGALIVWDVEDRRNRRVERALADVVDDADDLDRHDLLRQVREMLAERILPWEVLPLERAVDNRDARLFRRCALHT